LRRTGGIFLAAIGITAGASSGGVAGLATALVT